MDSTSSTTSDAHRAAAGCATARPARAGRAGGRAAAGRTRRRRAPRAGAGGSRRGGRTRRTGRASWPGPARRSARTRPGPSGAPRPAHLGQHPGGVPRPAPEVQRQPDPGRDGSGQQRPGRRPEHLGHQRHPLRRQVAVPERVPPRHAAQSAITVHPSPNPARPPLSTTVPFGPARGDVRARPGSGDRAGRAQGSDLVVAVAEARQHLVRVLARGGRGPVEGGGRRAEARARERAGGRPRSRSPCAGPPGGGRPASPRW